MVHSIVGNAVSGALLKSGSSTVLLFFIFAVVSAVGVGFLFFLRYGVLFDLCSY